VRVDEEPFKETLVPAGEESGDRPLPETPLPGIEDPFA